jgi:hypothetical protein
MRHYYYDVVVAVADGFVAAAEGPVVADHNVVAVDVQEEPQEQQQLLEGQ